MKTLVFLVCIGLAFVSNAQNGAPKVPTDFELETPEDFDKHAALVRKCMAWLTQHSLDEYPGTRAELNAFALTWLSGHPTLKVDINSDAIPCLDKHEELFSVFVYGVALYQIKHPSETDPIALHVEGVRAVHRGAAKTKSLKRCRCLRSVRKAVRKEQLPEWVSEQLKN